MKVGTEWEELGRMVLGWNWKTMLVCKDLGKEVVAVGVAGREGGREGGRGKEGRSFFILVDLSRTHIPTASSSFARVT